MNKSKTYLLTPEGKINLEKELAALRGSREQALVELQRARSMGDLRENSAYHAARERLSGLDRQIIKAELTLRNSQVVEKNGNSTVQIGSEVWVDISGTRTNFKIVGDTEMDIKQKKISANSPIGKALLGKKEKDKIIVNTPSGTLEYKIIKIN